MSVLRIRLDNSVYHPGEQVNGRVELALKRKRKINRIELHVKGTEFSVVMGDDVEDRDYKEKRAIIDYRYTIMERSSLPAGAQILPFAFCLPANLPPSYKGTWSKISYKIKVHVDIPMAIELRGKAQLLIKWDSDPMVVDAVQVPL